MTKDEARTRIILFVCLCRTRVKFEELAIQRNQQGNPVRDGADIAALWRAALTGYPEKGWPNFAFEDSVKLLMLGRDERLRLLADSCRLLGAPAEDLARLERHEFGGAGGPWVQLWWAGIAQALSGETPDWSWADFRMWEAAGRPPMLSNGH